MTEIPAVALNLTYVAETVSVGLFFSLDHAR